MTVYGAPDVHLRRAVGALDDSSTTPSANDVLRYRIETRRTWFGRWFYIIHLTEHRSLPSRKFKTQEQALSEAREMLSYMR
ncbi:hypothetical protein EV561_13346 [Rhizobium sp. BK376]|nr:hypothetical protein EV561_13346 [Rhizobium sp. BK376]